MSEGGGVKDIDLHLLPRVSKAGIETQYCAIQVRSMYRPIHILRAVWYLILYSTIFYTMQMVLYWSNTCVHLVLGYLLASGHWSWHLSPCGSQVT